jgi:hypothetical protein
MSGTPRATGHLQVKFDHNGARSYFAFWRDEHGCTRREATSSRARPRLGSPNFTRCDRLASGRRPRPTRDHLTPK